MANEQRYIAVDLGAESGRVMIGSVTDDDLSIVYVDNNLEESTTGMPRVKAAVELQRWIKKNT